MPKTRRRNQAREQFWRDTVAAWRQSGQSVRAFCAARGVSEATFFARRRELVDRAPLPQPTATGTGSPIRPGQRRSRPDGRSRPPWRADRPRARWRPTPPPSPDSSPPSGVAPC